MNKDIFRLAHSVRMSAEEKDLAEVMLYGEIVQDYGEWYKREYPNDKSASDFDRDIKKAKEDGATRLLLRINSPGGICTQSIAMRSILANAGFEEINIRIEGLCASAATNIATLPGAHVQIAEGSEYMIHNPWTIAWGFASDLERAAEHLRSIEKTTYGFYAKKSGQTYEQIKKWCDAETWFSAEEAVKYGFCDELLEAKSQKEAPAAACVSRRAMETMKSLYKTVPDAVKVYEEGGKATPALLGDDAQEYIISPDVLKRTMQTIKDAAQTFNGSNASPVAGETSVNKNKEDEPNMEIKELTGEQLLAENPALVEEIRQQAVTAERQRIQDIMDAKMTGYDEMAEKAIKDGTDANTFMRQMIADAKKKPADFLANRQKETAPAQKVTGGAAEDEEDEDSKIKAEAKKIADAAQEYMGGNHGMF